MVYFCISNCPFICIYQVLKLQETPENIPQGEMPRHLTVYCERVLCEKVAPGARVIVLGIYSIKKIAKIGVSCVFYFIYHFGTVHVVYVHYDVGNGCPLFYYKHTKGSTNKNKYM